MSEIAARRQTRIFGRKPCASSLAARTPVTSRFPSENTRLSMSRLFDGLAIRLFDGLPATGSRVL